MTRRGTLLWVVATVAAFAACTACTDDRSAPAPDPDNRGGATRCDSTLDAAFAAWATAGFSGSVAVSTGGRFDCVAGYGSANDATGTPNTAETVFSLGSVTKAVTAASVLGLAEDGKLALDDRAGALLPELRGPVAGVTVRQLLLHTGGLSGSIGNDSEPLDRDAAIAAIAGLELAFEPGSGFVYSNAGYTLLALIIEKVTGTSYRSYTVSKTLRLPDGRTAGGFWNGAPAAPGPRAVGYLDGGRTGESGDFAGPHWAVDGNGGLAMTPRDLADWTHALFTGRIVSPESVAVIGRPGHDLGGGRAETPGWVAHDASVHGSPFLATAGGGGDVGHNAIVVWVPERQRVIVMTSNRGPVSAEVLLAKVGPALLSGAPLPTPSPPPGAAGGTDAAGTTGRYTLDTGGSFDVTAAGNRVTVSATGADAVAALFPPGNGVSAADFQENERRVAALLAGQTREGRKERDSLEGAFGSIREIRPAGTLFQDGDVRSYVVITAGTRSILAWYSVDEKGGVRAAEVPVQPPALSLVPAGDRYRPADPAGAGPDVTVEFRDDRMTVTGPAGATAARRTG